MTRVRILLARLRSILWTALTLVTIVAAIAVGIGKLLMPYSTRYQPQLETWLSNEFGRPVKIESFTGEWKAFGPRISLQGLTFIAPGAEEGEIAIQRAALDIKPINSLLPGEPVYSFHIIGADLALEQTEDGRWALSGLGVSGREADTQDGTQDGTDTNLLEIVGQLRLEDSRLSLSMPAKGISARFTEVRGRLQLNGLEIAVEIEAGLSNQAGEMVLGDLKATLLLELDGNQKLSGARWHAKTRELMVGALAGELAGQMATHPLIPRAGRLNAELWGQWAREQGQSMQGVVDLRDAEVAGENDALPLDHLNARFNWRFNSRKAWRLDFSEFDIEENGLRWGSDRLSVERNLPGNLGLWVSADSLALGFPLQLTQRIMSVYRTQWPRHIPRRIEGQVSDFELVLDRRWRLYRAAGQFDQVSASDWGRWPDVSGISGEADLLAGSGEASFSGQRVNIDWPRNFRRTLEADVACTLDIGWGGKWQVHARDCQLNNDMISAAGKLHFAKTEGKPAVDINVVVERADVAQMDAYWPHALVKPKISDWLSRSLVKGSVDSAHLSLRGDMDDWPFSGNEGHLEAAIRFRDLDLDYYQAWPRAAGATGSAVFEGVSMSVAAELADLSGNRVREVTADIKNLRAPVLDLRYQTDTTLPGLLRFIRQTPLLARSELDLDQFEFSGEAAIAGALTIPIGRAGGQLAVSGDIELPGNGFTELRSDFSLSDVSGRVSFDQDSLNASELSVAYRGLPGQLNLDATWGERSTFRSEMWGDWPIMEVLPEPLVASEPLLRALDGTAAMQAVLTVEDRVGEVPGDIWLEVSSNLQGVSIDLPEPLNKAVPEAWPLSLRYPIRAENPLCSVDLKDRIKMLFDVPDGFDGLRRAHFQLGPGAASLPSAGEFSLAGDVSRLDLDAWVQSLTDRFAERSSDGDLVLKPVLLHADSLLMLGREFPDVDLEIGYEEEILRGSFDSQQLAGGMRYSRSDDGSHSVIAQLDRLFLPPPGTGDTVSETDPATLPEMHIYIDRFSYLGLELGETRIEAYPRGDGFRIASIEAHSPDFTLNARGDWVKDDTGERSDFDIVMTSESLGSLIDALDISSVLEGGQTVVRYDAWWPGPPAEFALARLNGEMNFNVIQGTIINADAGAGRMVGLMSITALPRRLAFDFRDVFGTGFSFDEAAGAITLENGIAHTNDLVLKSTAATMEIKGSSSLDEQTFDYILSIKPGVGQALPVLGALAAGPGGAAAGLALQGLFQKSLGEAAEARYSITGPWKEPRVVRIPMEPQSAGETENDRPAKDR